MLTRREDFEIAAEEALQWAADYLQNPREHAVTPAVRPGDLVKALPAAGPEDGAPLQEILRDFHATVMPAVVHWNHPRFFNYFACNATEAGVVAEVLAATLNSNGLNWVGSPAVVELEQVVLRWLRQWMGLAPDYFGQIFDTASVSTFHAVVAAREYVDPESRWQGMNPKLRAYASEQAHSSIDKAILSAGMGLANLRKIPADDNFSIDVAQLRQALEADRAAGLRPALLVATVGTTSTTSIDNVAAMADLAEEFGCWLHIDAAYAGSAAICPEHQAMLKGQERAHSLVMNPHKWLFAQMDVSVLYTRFPAILHRAFTITPEYLRTESDPAAVNLMDYGLPLGRRFRALKLWFLFRHYGRAAMADEIRRHIALAQTFARWVGAEPRWELTAPTPFSTVCFRLRASEEANAELLDRVNGGHRFFISRTRLRGQLCLRVAIGHRLTTEEDLAELWALLQETSQQPSAAPAKA